MTGSGIRTPRHVLLLLTITPLLIGSGICRAQAAAEAARDTTSSKAPEVDEEGTRTRLNWNEFDGSLTSVRFGLALAYDFVTFAQDDASKQQVDLESQVKARDTRLVLAGRLKTKRPITWKAGIMYDGASEEWFIRESGINIATPELWGSIFVGRTKEGFSLNKVMNGYLTWTPERQMALDVIPILADGVRWKGYLPDRGILWNLGGFTDVVSANESFSTFDWQFAARVAWLPMRPEKEGKLLHLGVSARYGHVEGGEIQVRSRPESNPAPYFIDTGLFSAPHSQHLGVEGYYQTGPWMLITEYYLHEMTSPEAGDPLFHGGEVAGSWHITGEKRAYSTDGGFIDGVRPTKSVFDGGPGAWEAVLRLSYLDLNSGTLTGGQFWRVTPMVNWWLNDYLRMDFAYGYGNLDRFGLSGNTQFFQGRIQFLFM